MVDPLTLFVILVVILVLFIFIADGVFLIHENQVGILTKKMGGRRMPPGQVIARHGQIGVQAATLVPGLYWRMPIVWTVAKVPIVEVPGYHIATVESIDGNPLPKGRLLGDEVECNQFQDAEKFLDRGGFKGPQVGILRPGQYRINTLAFALARSRTQRWIDVRKRSGSSPPRTGYPLPSRLIVAPRAHPVRTVRPPRRPGRTTTSRTDRRSSIAEGTEVPSTTPSSRAVLHQSPSLQRDRQRRHTRSRPGSSRSSGRTSGRSSSARTPSPLRSPIDPGLRPDRP